MYVCVYVHVCLFIHVYASMCTYIYIYTCTHGNTLECIVLSCLSDLILYRSISYDIVFCCTTLYLLILCYAKPCYIVVIILVIKF